MPSPPSKAEASANDATPPAAPVAADIPFLNREITWLEFNRRVLHEALDNRTPLLERLGFLAIFNSNLDEFYQKRVGGLKRQIEAGIMSRSADGLSPHEQLERIREMVLPMLDEQAACYRDDLLPALAEEGIHLLTWGDLTEEERQLADNYFHSHLFPVVTPLAVDPGHPFPFISNLSTSLGVMLRHPMGDVDRPLNVKDGEVDDVAGRLHFARVKVPQVLPRWVRLTPADAARDEYRFISSQQVIRHNLGELFEGMEIRHIEPFRITRNADVERDEEDAEDLLELIEQELRDRRFARAVRLETDDEPFHPMNRFLVQEMGLNAADVYPMPGLLDYTDLWEVHGQVNRPDLKFEPWTPVVPAKLADTESHIFSVIRSGDILVHHPYESFSASVERFIRTAATDPQVIAIKLTLYRTAKDSPFIPDLIKAAEAGKQVVVLVELKARFDEQRNVQLAQQLEKAGIHVVYGVVGYKTHTKTSLVIRREGDGIRTYAHIGTGNYNSKTANLYTDLGLFTCDTRITNDLVELFHFLTGRSVGRSFKHLLIAPTNMRSRFVEMIDREIAHAEAWDQGRGRPGRFGPGAGQDRRADDHRQDEQSRGRGPRGEALRRQRGGRAGQADRPRLLLPEAGRPGPEREHHRHVRHRPLPRAQPHLLLPQRLGPRRRPRRVLHRQRRLDVPQPQQPRRMHHPDLRPHPHHQAAEDPRRHVRRPSAGLGHGRPRPLHPADPTRR